MGADILTPRVRQQMVDMVDQWLRQNPPPANMTGAELKDYIESLIRYRLRNPLDAAAGKTPVLGGVGVADGLSDIAEIFGNIYIESGVFDIGEIKGFTLLDHGPLDEIYDAATLHIGDIVDPLDPLVGEIDPEDMDAIPTDPRVADGQSSLALPADNAEKKLAQMFCPASLWTGKLRYFVQSIYGSPTSTYSVDFPGAPVSMRPALELADNVQLGFEYPGSYVLYTSSAKRHFLFEIGRTSVNVWEIGYKPVVGSLQDDIRSGAIDITTLAGKKKEGVLFSQYNSLTSIGTFPITDPIQEGRAPIAYGWKSNWSGDEWAMVTVEKDECSAHMRSTRYSCSVVHTETPVGDGYEDSFEITVSEEESQIYEHDPDSSDSTLSRWWVPEYASWEMFWWDLFCAPYPGCSVTITANNAHPVDAPVYCWYDDTDTLKILKYTRTEQAAGTYGVNYPTSDPQAGTCGCDGVKKTYTKVTTTAPSYTYRLFIDSVAVNVVRQTVSSAHNIIYEWNILNPNFVSVGSTGLKSTYREQDCELDMTWAQLWYDTYGNWPYYTYRLEGALPKMEASGADMDSGNCQIMPMIAIPFGDSEAVMIGAKATTTGAGVRDLVIRKNGKRPSKVYSITETHSGKSIGAFTGLWYRNEVTIIENAWYSKGSKSWDSKQFIVVGKSGTGSLVSKKQTGSYTPGWGGGLSVLEPITVEGVTEADDDAGDMRFYSLYADIVDRCVYRGVADYIGDLVKHQQSALQLIAKQPTDTNTALSFAAAQIVDKDGDDTTGIALAGNQSPVGPLV